MYKSGELLLRKHQYILFMSCYCGMKLNIYQVKTYILHASNNILFPHIGTCPFPILSMMMDILPCSAHQTMHHGWVSMHSNAFHRLAKLDDCVLTFFSRKWFSGHKHQSCIFQTGDNIFSFMCNTWMHETRNPLMCIRGQRFLQMKEGDKKSVKSWLLSIECIVLIIYMALRRPTEPLGALKVSLRHLIEDI